MDQSWLKPGGKMNSRKKSFYEFLIHMRFMGIFCLVVLLMSLNSTMARAASILGHIKIDNFGYRTADYKIAYFTSNPGTTVGVYNASTSQLAYSVPSANITSKGTDTTGITGDTVWWVNFSAFTTAGTYYIYSTSLNEQSYNFQISDCVYQAPMTATLKALYYQRCGCAKPAQYAGANWADASACHLQDKTCGPAPGCTFPKSYGTLDLSGGWHDAGDDDKDIGADSCSSNNGDTGEALHDLLLAYEWNPTLFTTGQTNIPEPDAGVPDVLEEAKWELDWYLKMQMTDKHVLSLVHATTYTTGSPPSTDTTVRYYMPPNGDTEAQFVALLSNSARVLSTVSNLASYATTLRSAAEATWNTYETTWTSDDYKLWAAAEIFRMEEALGGPASIETAAQSFVNNYESSSWGGGFYCNENLLQQNWGIVAYIESTNATAAVVTNMKAAWSGLMNDIFTQTDSYNSAMHVWDYTWGANELKMNYAMELLWGAKLGTTGSQSVSQCLQHAEDFLHYMNGANTLNMTYMTNSSAIGASHGIWRIYHQWFGYNYYNTGPGTYSYDNFIGKPTAVVDPLYPYFSGVDNYGVSDSGPSSFGPPPGIVADGASDGYYQFGGKSVPPLLTGGAEPPYEKGYRDWDWSDQNGNASLPWIVNETGLYYTASYFIVASNFTTVCSNSTPTNTATMTATQLVTNTATNTATETKTSTATMTSTNTATNTPTNTATKTPTATQTQTSTNTPTNTTTNTASITSTNTATSTATNSPTATSTQTPTNTTTFTGTPPPTYTYTNTATNTSTSTATNTATTTATSTATNSPTGTATNSMTNTSTDTATVTSTNTATNTATVTDTYTVTSTFTNTGTATSTLTSTNTPTVTDTYTVTNTATVTSTYTNTNTSTNTFTPTHTPTVTPTFTATATSSATSTYTFTGTPTSTFTATSTSTITPTYTATVSSVIVISQPYPNPSNGFPVTFNVNVPSQSTVTADVFTTAFRKIRSLDYRVYGFQSFQWDLKDAKGAPAANGLYYVRIQVLGAKPASKIEKILILR